MKTIIKSSVNSHQSAVCGLQSAVFSLQSAVCGLRSVVCSLLLALTAYLLPLAASANLTNTWQFDNAAHYEVSDPALIRANPAGGGRAELILQESMLDQSAIRQYVDAPSLSGVRLGSEQVLELTKDQQGLYTFPGVYRSRIIDRGAVGSWEGLFTRVSNTLLENSVATISVDSPGLAALFRMDNDFVDAVSGNAGARVGNTFFQTESIVGSHSSYFGRGGHVVTSGTSVLDGATAFSVTAWVRPGPNQYDINAIAGIFPPIAFGGRLFIGHVSQNTFSVRVFDGRGGPTAIVNLPYFLPREQWTMLTVTWDNSTGTLNVYFNKDLQGLVTVGGGHPDGFAQTQPIWIACDPLSINRRFGGNIDELAFWRRALTEDEVGALIDNLRTVQFRLRSSSNPVTMPVTFTGPDGTSDSRYLGVGERLVAGGSFDPIHRYLQYEARLLSDGQRRETPQIQYVKFTAADGSVQVDGTAGDFLRGTRVQSITNAPYTAYTPYLGLARQPNGGFRTAGSYRSEAFDSGNVNSAWERLRWRLPSAISSSDSGLVALYHLDGNWVDVAPTSGANNPTVQSNVAFSTASRLGFNAAYFTETTGGSTVSGFFSAAQTIATMSFWIKAENMSDGILSIGDGRISLSDHQIVSDGYGGNSPAIYVNANPQSAYLNPGWNHVALVWPSAVSATNLVVGMANGDSFNGLLDELALYSTSLTMGQIQVQYFNAHPISSGAPTFRVRAADTLTALNAAAWSVSFIDPETASFSVRGRYFQYEGIFSGDGSGTPVAGNVRVEGNDGVNSFTYATATFAQASKGDFGSGSTTWYGDEIYVENFATTDPANLQPGDFQPADVLAGLWHFDEQPWGIGTVLTDSSGRGRPGSPVNGPRSSPNARVGFRSGSFDGLDDYVELSQISELAGTDFSVGLWYNSRDTREGSLISTFAGSGSYMEIALNNDGTQAATGKVAFVINDGVNGERAAVSPAANLNNGAWRHVAGVRSGGFIHLYIDGVRMATTAIGSYGLLAPGTPRIMRNGSGTRYLAGFVDEVAIFGSALSPKKVGTIFASGYSTKRINEMTFAPVDAGGPTIWQTLRWTTDGIYGSPLQAATGVQGLWHLDETAGTSALDSSGGGRNAVMTGTTPGQGVFAGGRFFNGSGDHLRVPHTTALEGDNFSVELWVKPESLNNRTLLDKRNGSNGYALTTDSIGRLTFQVGSGLLTDSLPLLQNVWQHVAATYDGATLRLYVNGELRGSTVPVGAVVASGADLYIGRAAAGGQFLHGTLDEVAYHARRLLDTEVLDHYRAYAGTLKFQVRAGDVLPLDSEAFYGPDGTAASYFTLQQNNNLRDLVPLVRYLQVKAYIGTEDHRFSPTFYGLSVSASRYPENAPWIAPTTARGYPFLGTLLGFDHTRTFNLNTDVKYQISGDASSPVASNRWFYYNPSAGNWAEQVTNGPAIFEFQTSTRDQVAANIGKFYEQIYNATGGLFRFKAFLKSGGDRQVAVSNVTVTASRGRVVVISPNGGERGEHAWIASVPYPLTWSWQGTVSDNLEVAYSTKGFSTLESDWTVIAAGVAKGVGGTNSLTWTTPQPPQGVPIFTNVVVRIRDLNDATVMDMSDAPFEITQKFKVTAPNGGERWYIGEENTIRWESAHDLSTRASIYMAPDGVNFAVANGGYEIEFLATNVNASADNSFTWTTPRHVASLLSTNAKVRVQAPNGAYADDSDAAFSMVGIVITSPAAGQKVKRGDPYTVRWRSISGGTNVHVDVSLDGGATYATNLYSFVENADGENTVVWDVTQPESDTAVLRIRSLEDDRIIGISEVFTIAGIDVLAPDGGEEWLTGSLQQIRWVAGGAGNTVSIFYTDLYDGTNTVWLPIAERTANTLSYNWTVSDRVSPNARVKIQSDEDPNLFAISEQNFNIAGVRVTYPNLFNDTLVMGRQAMMTHAGAPMRWLRVKLEISYDRAATWQVLGLGAEEWTLRQPFQFLPTFPSRQTKVRATVLGATTPEGAALTNIVDLSDEYFTVEGLLMEAPLAGSTNTLGSQSEIRWVSAGGATAASIYYSHLGTNNFALIAQGVFNNQTYPGRNPYNWQIPATLLPSPAARIKVVTGNYEAMTDPFILRGIRVTAPTNNAVLSLGSQSPISWTYAGMSVTSRGTISLSLDGGATYTVLQSDYDLISVPFLNWSIDPDLDPTTNALIRLRVLSSDALPDIGFTAASDRFTLKGIKILTPAAGGTVRLGETNTIAFIAAAAGQSAKIEYSSDGGATYDPVPIAQNLAISDGPNAFAWTVDNTRKPSSNAVIRITGTADTKVSGVFNLGGIRVDRPMQYDIWAVGEINPILWVAQVPEPLFNLDLVYPDGFTLAVAQSVAGNSRSYQLPVGALRGQETISNVVLRVVDRQGTTAGFSEPFRLVSQPLIEIVSPKAGDFLRVGDEVQVVWVKGGSMQAEQFSVWFSRDGFTTPPEDIARDVTLNPENNTFSMPWVVPDRIGRTQIMVTNSVNPSLTTLSGEFDIVGNFELIFPNGDPGEEALFANQVRAASWFTEGSVEYVNIFYKVAGQSWVKANIAPVSNNPRQGRYQTFYEWAAPILRADQVLLRVQDAAYPDPNRFDGTKAGPYDDSDNPFGINFFSVTWDIRYRFENEDGSFTNKPLDKLSATDSAGWSVTGLESPFTTNYPYGTFDTVWYRQFFNDKVDFRWLSDRDQTRTLVMEPSDTEPDAYVLASFTYDPGEKSLTIYSWIERGGRILNNPDRTTVHIYDTAGNKMKEPNPPYNDIQLTSSDVLAEGFFRLKWENVLEVLRERETYLARVEVMYNRVIYSAAVTYTLSLAPEFEQVQGILDRVTAMETNLTSRVSGIATNLSDLTAITTNFEARAMGSLGTLQDSADRIEAGVGGMAAQMTNFTETVIAPLAALTNEVVGVLGPTLTNMAAMVSNLVDSAGGEQARILNRPSTVEFGSTNTILFRVTSGVSVEANSVTLQVIGMNRQSAMTLLSANVYSADLIADWGIGSFIIQCYVGSASSPLQDRMVLEVVAAGAGSMGELAETVQALETQITGMNEVMETLTDPVSGLEAMMREIDSGVAEVEAALGAAIAGGGIGGDGAAGSAAATLEALLGSSTGGGGGGEASLDSLSLMGRIVGMSSRLEEIYGSSSDAATAAMGAKNQAGAAANAARELKEMLSGEYSMENAMGRIDLIRRAVETANANIENIPRAVGAQAMQSQLQAVAAQIAEMAAKAGYEYEVPLTPAGVAAAAGEAADQEMITVLNQNMNEVKVSLEFMQKVLDEKINEPVVVESWLGVE